MKIIVVIAGICFLIALAGNKAISENKTFVIRSTTTDTVPVSTSPSNPTIIIADSALIGEGLALIGMSDCTTCHRLREKSISPSYKAIAARYKPTQKNIDLLIKRTIEGCSGVWSKVPMTRHPDLSVSDAQKMMLFIFSVK